MLFFGFQRCLWKPAYPDLEIFCHFGNILKVFGQFLKSWFPSWQNVEPIWAKILCFWAKLHCYKWPNIKQQSSHLVTLHRLLGKWIAITIEPLMGFRSEICFPTAQSTNLINQWLTFSYIFYIWLTLPSLQLVKVKSQMKMSYAHSNVW